MNVYKILQETSSFILYRNPRVGRIKSIRDSLWRRQKSTEKADGDFEEVEEVRKSTKRLELDWPTKMKILVIGDLILLFMFINIKGDRFAGVWWLCWTSFFFLIFSFWRIRKKKNGFKENRFHLFFSCSLSWIKRSNTGFWISAGIFKFFFCFLSFILLLFFFFQKINKVFSVL